MNPQRTVPAAGSIRSCSTTSSIRPVAACSCLHRKTSRRWTCCSPWKNILGGGFFSGRTGVDFLPKGLAAQLDVRLTTKVVSVHPREDGIEVSYQTANAAQHTERVAGCVIALPAPQMLQIYPQPDPIRRNIACRVGYTNALGVHFGLSRKPVDEPAALIQIPQREHPWLTGVVLDHNKAPGRAPEPRGLISTFWQQRWVTQRWERDDASIAQDAVTELATVLPALVRDIECVHAQRWRPGIVQARTGAYRELAAFQPAPNSQPRVQLAADFCLPRVRRPVFALAKTRRCD